MLKSYKWIGMGWDELGWVGWDYGYRNLCKHRSAVLIKKGIDKDKYNDNDYNNDNE